MSEGRPVLSIVGAVFLIAVLYSVVKRLASPPRQEPDDEPDRW